MRRHTRHWSMAGAFSLAVLLGGCAAPVGEVPVTTGSPGSASSEPVPDDVRTQDDVRMAIGAEAERRGVSPDQVEVVSYEQVTWSDGSLGCPQPGVMYTQALVPGRRLVLRVGDAEASYHAGRSSEFAFCAAPALPLPDETAGR